MGPGLIPINRRYMAEKTHRTALYLDPPSYHFLSDRLFNVNDGRLNGDAMNAPYAHLRDFFALRGIPVRTADYLPERADGVNNIYVSMGNLKGFRKLVRRSDTVLSAFFAMECPIVEPSMYRELGHAQRYFKRIFSWSDGASLSKFTGTPLQLESFRWPQSFSDVHEAIWRQTNRKFLVMINANKLPRIYWQELYTERLRAMEFFSRTQEIDLYGMGWDGPPYRVGKSWMPGSLRRLQRKLFSYWQCLYPDPILLAARRAYRGPTPCKAETLGDYTFALCFENMVLKGWITEKIFDCFFAGTVPIYWGAPDIETYIPQECFIDMRRFGSYQELMGYLKSLNQVNIQKYKEAVREYLRSPQFQPFTKEAFTSLFVRILEEDAIGYGYPKSKADLP